MTLGILIGTLKGKYIVIGEPGHDIDGMKKTFKESILSDGKINGKQYEEIQFLNSVSGRVKRKKFDPKKKNNQPSETEES
jgi:hypothetical protein